MSSREIYDIPPDFVNNKVGMRFEEDCRKLQIGQGFIVKFDEIKEGNLRSRISVIGKKIKYKFSVQSYPERKCYFVARVKK